MKIPRLTNKPKIKEEDLQKIDSTIKEIKDCLYCRIQKNRIKECAESKDVKDSLKSVTWHILKCSDCRTRIKLIADCKKRGHK